MLSIAETRPGKSQEAGAASQSSMWVAEAHVFAPSSIAFLSINRELDQQLHSGSQTRTHMGWNAVIADSGLPTIAHDMPHSLPQFLIKYLEGRLWDKHHENIFWYAFVSNTVVSKVTRYNKKERVMPTLTFTYGEYIKLLVVMIS